MSVVVNGYPGATLVRQAPRFDAATNLRVLVTEYQGPEAAILGFAAQVEAAKLSYRTDHVGPIWSLFVEEPIQDVDENLDRWEIQTESTDKSIFELPEYIRLAADYDASIEDGADTFRQAAEKAAQAKNSTFTTSFLLATDGALAEKLVYHLKSGVTGWQVDLIALSRTRKMSRADAQGNPVNLDTGLFIYSTAQLGLPNSVAFSLPATPSDVIVAITATSSIDSIFRWGWRRRSQRVEIVDSYVEQTVQFLFAPWSLTEYTPSASNFVW